MSCQDKSVSLPPPTACHTLIRRRGHTCSQSMPYSFVFTALFVLWLSETYGQARTFTQAVPSNAFWHHCAFEIGDYGYDLCPLMQRQIVVNDEGVVTSGNLYDREERSSNARPLYEIAFGGTGSLARSGSTVSSPTRSQCEDNTWICLLDKTEPLHERADDSGSGFVREELRLLPKVKTSEAAVFLDVEESDSGQADPVLRLRLEGKEDNGIRSAEINLLCSDIEHFQYIAVDSNARHFFLWATKHGCPKVYPRRNVRFSTMEEPAGEKDDKSSPTEEKENESDDDLLPKSNMSRTRRLIAISVTLLITSLVFGTILFSSTNARHFTSEKLRGVSHLLTSLMSTAFLKLRPVGNTVKALASKSAVRFGSRFRQGDSRLVRWAQEDMSLSDSEDVMVNGSGAYGSEEDGWNGDGLEEYIPLNISPRHGRSRSVRSYGATPDVETFAERRQGLLSGIGNYFKK